MKRKLIAGIVLLFVIFIVNAKEDFNLDVIRDTIGVLNDEETGETEITQYEVEWPDYAQWEVVTIDGKLKMQGLPLSPSIKIYMERGRMLNMSIRAPFFGEVGSMVVTKDTITLINKMNKTYVKEGTAGFGGGIMSKGIGINEIQDLLLGRFFLPGHDVVTADLDELVDVYYEDGQFNIIPKNDAEIEGIKYGFIVDEQFNPIVLVVLPQGEKGMEFSVEYIRKLQGYDLLFSMLRGNITTDVTLEFKNPEWRGEAPKAIDLKKYKKLGFEEFMRSIG